MANEDLDRHLSKLSIDRSKRSPGKKPYAVLVLFAVAIAVLGGGGYLYFTKVNAAVEVAVAQPVLETAGAPRSSVLTAGGYIIARDVYEISSKIVGQVKEILVDRGDLVKAGDLIIRIEDDEYVAQVRLAEAQVASAKAQLDQLLAGSRPEEISQARANVVSAKATLAQAAADVQRFEQLAKEAIVSAQDLDVARANYEVAEANLDAVEERARLVEIGPRQEEIDIARAELQQAEANLEFAKTQLSFTVIHAPIDGTILEKVAKKGELVTNTNFGGTRGARSSVVSMADLTDLQVEVDVNEDDLAGVWMGQACRITLDSRPNDPIEGVVDEIAPRADRQKATVEVKVRILDPPDFVRPELSARAAFLSEEKPMTESDEPALWVPRSAIVNSPGGPAVYIVFEGKALLRPVTTGVEGPNGIEIKDGLVGSESLITNPSDAIRDGTPVNPA